MPKPKWKRENVKMKQTEQKKEDLWEVVDPLPRPQTAKKVSRRNKGREGTTGCLRSPNDRKYFKQPDDTEDHEGHCLVASVKLDQEKNHAYHDRAEDQAVCQMRRYQI